MAGPASGRRRGESGDTPGNILSSSMLGGARAWILLQDLLVDNCCHDRSSSCVCETGSGPGWRWRRPARAVATCETPSPEIPDRCATWCSQTSRFGIVVMRRKSRAEASCASQGSASPLRAPDRLPEARSMMPRAAAVEQTAASSISGTRQTFVRFGGRFVLTAIRCRSRTRGQEPMSRLCWPTAARGSLRHQRPASTEIDHL